LNLQNTKKNGNKPFTNLSSEEATNFKATSIALASELKIELADGNRRKHSCNPKTAGDATLLRL
jgi:hypothetical protein